MPTLLFSEKKNSNISTKPASHRKVSRSTPIYYMLTTQTRLEMTCRKFG